MNGGTLAAIGLSLVSAVAYASAAVAQERLAARTDPGTGLRTLLGRGAWWWAVGLNAGGALLHVAALTYGSLTVVQPLGALTLVAAVPLGARRAGRQVSRGEWRGTAYTLVGLAAILLAAAGTSPSETLSLPQALAVAGAAMALVVLLTRTTGRPGLRHAAASGITSGVASALTQTVTVAAAGEGANTLPMWQVAGVALLVAAFASGGLLLSQTAYQGGLGAPLALLTLANPVAAAAIGLTLLGERLQGGALGIAAAGAGAVAAARGVVLLTRSTAPVPAGQEVAAVPVPERLSVGGPSLGAGAHGAGQADAAPASGETQDPGARGPDAPAGEPPGPAAPAAQGPPDPAVPVGGPRAVVRARTAGRRRVYTRPSGRRRGSDQWSRQSTRAVPPAGPGACNGGVVTPVLPPPGTLAVKHIDFGYSGHISTGSATDLPAAGSGGPVPPVRGGEAGA